MGYLRSSAFICGCETVPNDLTYCVGIAAAPETVYRAITIVTASKSGAKATALQTLTRLPRVTILREAFGVRRVHRRFL